MEMSPEGVSGVFDGFVSCADETASLQEVMATIKCGG
jgi:hypothetical protein